MPANDLLSSVVAQEAYDQLARLRKDLAAYVKEMNAASKLSVGAGGKLEDSSKFSDVAKNSKAMADANKLSTASFKALSASIVEAKDFIIQLNGQSEKHIRVAVGIAEVKLKEAQARKTNAEAAKIEGQATTTAAEKSAAAAERAALAAQKSEVKQVESATKAAEAKQGASDRATAKQIKDGERRAAAMDQDIKKENALADRAWQKQLKVGEARAAAMDREIKKEQDLRQRQELFGEQYIELLKREQDAFTKKQAKEQALLDKSNTAYERLKATHAAAERAALNLGAAYGVESAEAADAINKAKQLNDQLVELESATGNHRRKVGQYENATFALSQLIREAPAFANGLQVGFSALSNNFAGLFDQFKALRTEVGSTSKALGIMFKSLFGFTNLFILGYAAFEIFGKTLFKTSEATKKAREEQDRYNESLKSLETTAYASASAEVARLNLLITISQDLKQSMETRILAVQSLQKEFPKYFGNLDQEAVLNGRVADAVNEATQAIFKKAAANAATSKFESASKREYELLVQQKAALKEVNDLHAKYDKIIDAENEKFRKGDEADAGPGRIVKAAEDRLAVIVKERNDIRKQMRGFLNDAQTMAQELGADFFKNSLASPDTIAALQEQVTALSKKRDELVKINTKEGVAQAREISAEIEKIQARIAFLQGKDDKAGKTPRDQTLKNEQDLTKELYDEYAKRLLIDAEYQKAIYEDETKSMQERLTAYQAYEELTFEAQAEALSARQDQVQQSLDAIAKIEAKSADKRTQQEKDLLGRKAVFLQQFNTISAEYDLLRTQNIEKTAKGIVDIQQKEVHKRAEAIKDLSDNVDIQEAEAQRKLSERYVAGTIKYKAYTQEKKRLEEKFQKEKQAQIVAYLQAEIDALSKQGVNTVDLQRLLNQALKGLYDADVEAKIKAEKEKEEATKRLRDKEVEAVGEAINLGQALLDGFYERQLQKEQDKLDAIETNKQAQIDAINNSMQSEDKKQKAIQALNAQTALQEKQLHEEMARIKRRQAIADRVAAILRVVSNTAVAVTSVISIPIVGQILAGINAAIGAAQIAAILATPLPQYGDGVRGHRGGPAVLGDKYERELVQEPGKAPYWSSDTPMVYDLKPGTNVTPERLIPPEELIAGSLGFMTPSLMKGITINNNNDNSRLEAAVRHTGERMEKAIQNMPQTSFKEVGGSIVRVVRRGNSTTTYLNDNFC